MNIKWTLPLVKKEAKKYQTRGAFQKGSKGAYRYAYKHMDDLFPGGQGVHGSMDRRL